MIENRSVPPDTVLPHVTYQDLAGAIVWLSKTFGFREHYRYGEPLSGAQVHLGNAWISVLKQAGQVARARRNLVARNAESDRVQVEDVEGHFQRAKAAGR